MIQQHKKSMMFLSGLSALGLLVLMIFVVRAATNSTDQRSQASSVSCDFSITVRDPNQVSNANSQENPIQSQQQAATIPSATPQSQVQDTTPVPTQAPTTAPVSEEGVPQVRCDQKADIAIVLDRSSSMNSQDADGRSKLEWAKDAAALFVTAIKNSGSTQIKLSVVSYGAQGNDGTGTRDSTYNTTLDIAATTDYGAVLSAIEAIRFIRSGTCGQCGIRIGNAQISGSGDTKAVIFLSDGKINKIWNGTESDSKQAAITEANSGRGLGIAYYVLGYGSGTAIDEPTLKSIAGTDSNYTWRPNATDWSRGFIDLLPKFCTPI
jgi:hypothetical protein